MRHWLGTFKQWIWPGKRAPVTPLPLRILRTVAQQIEMTQAVEYSCDDVHRLLDQFAEAVLRGEDAAKLMPLVQSHLDMCPDCREEFEALMRILIASPA
jgi:hypothetical protein